MKISEILHLAADKHLAVSKYSNRRRYSCDAVRDAIHEVVDANCLSESERSHLLDRVFIGLEEMGVRKHSITQFYEFEDSKNLITPESQGARYTWLKFAAMIAEEQGV